MRLSRFAHLLSDNLVWHSLTKRAVELPVELYSVLVADTLRNEIDPIMLSIGAVGKELIASGIIVDDADTDKALLTRIIKAHQNPAIQSLFLMLKTQCNLKCDYCLLGWDRADTLLGPVKTMSGATALESIDHFASIVSTNQRSDGYWQAVTFYGGEPLMNKDVLIGAVDRIDELKVTGLLWPETEIVVNTNGLLVDEDFARYAVRNHIEVQVSLDGFKQAHDSHRVDHSGSGSFDRVIEAIRILIAVGAKVVPMITITDTNIPDLTQFVEWMAADLGITDYMMNLLMSGTGDTSAGYPTRAANAMYASFHYNLAEYGIYDSCYASKLEAFESPEIVRPSCGANGRKLTVFPDGQIHTCQAFDKADVSYVAQLGEFYEGLSNWVEWKNRSRFNNPQCLRCPMLGSCGAGCASGAYRKFGSIHAPDPNHCQWLKQTFDLWRG